MPEQSKDNCSNSKQAENTGEDLTGRDRLVSNVLFSWAAYLVFIVAGFIMPRMIDRRLGQELLGIWDFAWSLVSYFSLVQMGFTSSVNRYVARYRMAGDISGVNRIVSSSLCVMTASGLLVLGLTIAVSLLLPQFCGNRLGENAQEAQRVVLFLGASVAVQIALNAFQGVLTGCHRWGLHNINTSGWYAVTVVGMIVALLAGGRLWILAAIIFVGETLAAVRRMVLAHGVCEGLRVRPSMVGWLTIRELFVFGGKTLIPSVSNLLLNQTTSVLIMAYLGPAALALYARPRSLMHHVEIVIRKMSMTLIPTTSSLESAGDLRKILDLVIKSTRYSCYLALPIALVLIVFGGPIMQLWMGPRYADSLVPAILATGYLAALVQIPAWSIFVGLNAHGRMGLARFIASVGSVGLNVLVLAYLKWGLVGTAVAVTLPLTILNLVDIPLLVCRRVGLDVRQYFLSVVVGPAIRVSPFAVCLVVARILFHAKPLIGLALGASAGGLVLAVLYWRCVLPDRVKMWVCRCLHNVLRSVGLGFQHDQDGHKIERKGRSQSRRKRIDQRMYQFQDGIEK